MNATPDPIDELVEDSLKTYPVVSLPAGFTRRTLSRIHAVERYAPFRLLWIDYALSFFLTFLAGILYLVWKFLPQQLILRLELQWRILLSRVPQTNLVFGGMIAVAFLVAAFVLAAGLWSFPRSRGIRGVLRI